MPSIYYKYRKLDQYGESLLRSQQVYFSFGSEYNDPFDSKVVIDTTANGS